VLEVARDASQAEIQRAYREKVKQYHPDVSDHPDAADRFRAVKRAEGVLGDESERDRYDRLGHASYRRVVDEDAPGDGDGDQAGGAGDQHRTGQGRGRSSATGSADAGSTGGGPGGSTGTTGAGGGDGGAGGGSTRRGHTGPWRDDGWETTSGPTAGSSNPSQRGYAPWKSDDEETDAEETGDRQKRESDNERAGARRGPEASTGTGRGGATGGPRESVHEENPTAGASDRWEGEFGGETNFDQRTAGPSAGSSGGGTRRSRHNPAAGSTSQPDGFWSANLDTEVPTEPSGASVFPGFETRDSAILAVALLFIYPVFVYFSVSPALPTTVNLVIAGATAMVVVFMLTEPGMSLVVFGVWSLLAPLLLVFLGLSLLSPSGLSLLAAFWGPLVLTLLMGLALPG
jgi:curved DNA-binding protein CbpA